MKYQVLKGLILLILSTLSYYIPVYFTGLKDFDISTVPIRFYNYYCWTSSASYLLISVYAFYLFIFTNYKHLKIKLIFFWLFIAETYTFINHIIKKCIYFQQYNGYEIIITLIVFSICLFFILDRCLRSKKVSSLNKNKTYIVKFRPKNILGIFNYLYNLSGHFGIYQNGFIYKFDKRTKKCIKVKMISELSAKLNEINYVKNIDNLIGKKFNLLRFNCNSLVKYAKSGIIY